MSNDDPRGDPDEPGNCSECGMPKSEPDNEYTNSPVCPICDAKCWSGKTVRKRRRIERRESRR